jgi:hypothetical protein
VLNRVQLRDGLRVYPSPVPWNDGRWRNVPCIDGRGGLRPARARPGGECSGRRVLRGGREGVACAGRGVGAFGESVGVPLAAGPPSAGRYGEDAEAWPGARVRLCLPEAGAGGARADDRRCYGKARLVSQWSVRAELQGAGVQRRAGADVVGGQGDAEAQRRGVRHTRRIVSGGKEGPGGQRLQGESARFSHHPGISPTSAAP